MRTILSKLPVRSRFAAYLVIAVLGAFAAQADGLTVKSYLQNGLILQFDGLANGGWSEEDGEIHSSSKDSWTDIVSGTAATATGSKYIAVNPNYIYFNTANVSAWYSIVSTAMRDAVRAKKVTLQMMMRPESYVKWAGYFAYYNNTYRSFLFDQREDRVAAGNPFGGIQYLRSSWAAASGINVSNSSYMNTDVLASIAANSSGASLYLNDSTTPLYTAPAGTVLPAATSTNPVRIGCAGNDKCAKCRYYAVRIYNRTLDAGEIAYNYAIDRARFFGDTFNHALVDVKSTLGDRAGYSSIGAPNTVTYRHDCVDMGGDVVFTNVYGCVVSPSNAVYVAGYSLYGADSSLLATGSSGEFRPTFDRETLDGSTLVWDLTVSNKLAVTVNDSELGAVVGNSSDSFHLLDGAVTLTAVPAEGCGFLRWVGDLPSGVNEIDPNLSLVMDKPRNITARFYNRSLTPRYSRVEFIETTGKEWIDTGLKVKGSMNIVADIQPLMCGAPITNTLSGAASYQAVRHYCLFGGGDKGNLNYSGGVNIMAMAVENYNGGATHLPGIRSFYVGATTVKDNTRAWHYKTADNIAAGPHARNVITYTTPEAGKMTPKFGSTVLDYATYYHSPATFESTNNFFIANANVPDEDFDHAPAVMRIWSFKITDDGATVLDLVPVRNDLTGEAGLYDCATETFFGNASGEGAIVSGPALPSEWINFGDDNVFNYGVEWTVGGYSKSSTLKNVPVLVRISEGDISGFSYADCLEGGADIAFSSESDFSNRLPFEIDEWNTNGVSLVWVKVPVLSGTDTKIYMRYGRHQPSWKHPVSDVWSGDYVGVWHMNEYVDGAGATNSTALSLNATMVQSGHTVTTDAGIVGKSLKTDKGGYLRTPPCYNVPVTVRPDAGTVKWDNMPQHFTIEMWNKKYGTYKQYNDIVNMCDRVNWFSGESAKHRYGWYLEYYDNAGKTSVRAYHGTITEASGTENPQFADTNCTEWHHYAFSSDGYNLALYRDAISKSTKATGGRIGMTGERGITFGGGTGAANIGDWFDEVRLAHTTLSADRIATDYQMMTNPAFATAAAVTKLQGASLSVMATPAEYAADAIAYGVNDTVEEGDVVVNSAPEFVYLEGNEAHRALCLGWELYEVIDGVDTLQRSSATTEVPGENTTNAIVTIEGTMKLVWLWEEQWKIENLAPDPERGSIAGTGWFKNGTNPVITVVPEPGYRFLCWTGGVSTANSIASSITYTGIYTNHVALQPLFIEDARPLPNWLYIPTTGILADMNASNWFFTGVTRNGSNLSIPSSTSHAVPSSAKRLDLGGVIEDIDGNPCLLVNFGTQDYTKNVFGAISDGSSAGVGNAQRISSFATPTNSMSIQFASLMGWSKCTSFDFRCDYSSIGMRDFWKAEKCLTIRHHFFPPTVRNDSNYTYMMCGAEDYGFCIEYPDYLENAWLGATNVGAQYDWGLRMTSAQKTTALAAYRRCLGSSAPDPTGYVRLNFKRYDTGERRAPLRPFVEETVAGRIRVGVMGLPIEIAKSESARMSPRYGLHEYATGEDIVIAAPPQQAQYTGEYYVCKGYILTRSGQAPVTNRYQGAIVIPGSQADNVGITYLWRPGKLKGFAIFVK